MKKMQNEAKSIKSRSAEKKSQYPGYTAARKKANQAWARKQAQIAIRVAPEVKAALDAHVATLDESLASFVVRAIKEQIERDNAI